MIRKIQRIKISLSISIALVIIVTLAAIWFLWSTGFLRITNEENEVKIISASIALVGILWSSAATIIGLLLKHSIDNRSYNLQKEAESRLKMDTALKAIDIMTTPNITLELAQEKREAALISLKALNQLDLAVIFLENYWPTGLVRLNVAISIIDSCIRSDNFELQNAASDLLEDNNKLLITDNGFSFPDSVFLKWHNNLSSETKYNVFLSLMKCMLQKKKDDWEVHVRNQFLYCLYKIFTIDNEKRIKLSAAVCAKELVEGCGDRTRAFMPPDRHIIQYSEILEDANNIILSEGDIWENITVRAHELSLKIKNWESGDSHNFFEEYEIENHES